MTVKLWFLFQAVVLACVALAAAAPQAPRDAQEVQILRLESDNDGLGSYRFA